ncbi:MAG: hypothetical protein COA62_14960 [Rhodobiaceae bacterium]|nr:MAG: hypothetical protein COA62_14960 [Rhodobiaceae bacterium]
METKANMQAQRCAGLTHRMRVIQQEITTQRRELEHAEGGIRTQERRLENLDSQARRTGDPEGFSGEIAAARRELSQEQRKRDRIEQKIRDLETDLRELVNEFNSLRCGRDREA